jgi:hypothetical protein
MRDVDFESFDRDRIRRHAEKFSLDGFKQRFNDEVRRLTAL